MLPVAKRMVIFEGGGVSPLLAPYSLTTTKKVKVDIINIGKRIKHKLMKKVN